MLPTIKVQTETENVQTPVESNRLDQHKIQEEMIQKRINGMSKKKKLVGLLGILLLVIAAGYGWYEYSMKNKEAGYLTMPVTKGAITDSIEATGTLSAVKESEMGFKNDDTITVLNVQPGDHVKSGQILARQDSTTLETTLQQAIRTVEQDQISVKSAMLTYETKKKTLEQQQQLFDAGVISESDLDTAKDDLTKSEWDVATATSKLLNDQAKVEQARSDLEGATLVAPFDGIIGAVNGQVGQINGINSNSSTLLTVLSEDLQLSALVNEADIGRIKVGQEVEFTSSSFSDKTFKGEVLRITPQAETVSNVQYYPVLISCIDPEHQLLAGMSVSANIIIARSTEILTVPMMAASYVQSFRQNNAAGADPGQSPTSAPEIADDKSSADKDAQKVVSDRKQSRVVVLENGQPVVKTVVLGLNDGSNYEVIEGLNEGDQVIIGSSQVDTTAASAGSNSNNSDNSKTTQNRGGGGMGGPPPGF